MSAHMRDIGGGLRSHFGAPVITVTAGGAGDGTEVTGTAVDRLGLPEPFLSVRASIPAVATLASGETLSIAANLQDSANNSDWSDYGNALAATVVATGPSGGGVARGAASLDVDLSHARRYIRLQYTPDASRAGTDTATVGAASLLFGGGASTPE